MEVYSSVNHKFYFRALRRKENLACQKWDKEATGDGNLYCQSSLKNIHKFYRKILQINGLTIKLAGYLSI